MKYIDLIDSLTENAKKIISNGIEVEYRNCIDREEGSIDPRTKIASYLTKSDFENNIIDIPEELVRNREKLLGPENPELLTDLEIFRKQFGWRSQDITDDISCKKIYKDEYKVIIYNNRNEVKLKPCLFFIHGGGFFAGDVQTVENQCKLISKLGKSMVVSIDYPLSPEVKYPTALNVCMKVITDFYNNYKTYGINKDKFAIAGDSAGGNLALACCLKSRDEGSNMIKYQGLIYPAVSFAGFGEKNYFWNKGNYNNKNNIKKIDDEIRVIGDLNKKVVDWYFTNENDKFDRYATMIDKELKNLPKTTIFTAEYDFLREQDEVFAKRLIASNVDARIIRYGGIFHGTFDRLGYSPQVEDIIKEISKELLSL